MTLWEMSKNEVTSSSEAERGAVWLPTARAVSVCPVISATMGGTRTFVACEWCSHGRNEEVYYSGSFPVCRTAGLCSEAGRPGVSETLRAPDRELLHGLS